jgi:hypothetical protein
LEARDEVVDDLRNQISFLRSEFMNREPEVIREVEKIVEVPVEVIRDR